DMRKIYAAYHAAAAHRGQPVVILALTTKGFGMGAAGQGKMTTHQQKQLDVEQLRAFRDRFGLPIPDEDCEALSFYRPPENSPEMKRMRRRRQALGGFLPQRHTAALDQDLPDMPSYAGFALGEGGRNMSSTMAFVRMLAALMKSE